MNLLTEDQKSKKAIEDKLFSKWEPALNSSKYPAIGTDEMARTTAILMENYMQFVNNDIGLLTEDRISTGNIQGVNLALLGLIRRVIPELVGAELAGIQALPTPESPIFTLIWERDNAKSGVVAGQKMWDTGNPNEFGPHPLGEDPYYSSQQNKYDALTTGGSAVSTLTAGTTTTTLDATAFEFPNTTQVIIGNQRVPMFLYAGTTVVELIDANGDVVETHHLNTDLNVANAGQPFSIVSGSETTDITFNYVSTADATPAAQGGVAFIRTVDVVTGAAPDWGTAVSARLAYEYKVEDEQRTAELSFNIVKTNVEVKQRRLRGKFTLESSFDLKKLHGISLENELVEQMKVEMMNGINREIIDDLRTMAAHVRSVDFSQTGTGNQINIAGNYDDMHKALLDSIEFMCAEIAVKGRLGHGNFIVVNPMTFSTLARVPGFVGSGVNYDGKGLRYAGSLGGSIKVYQDVQYPRNELLLGYKGSTATDCGYIHAPYLPITPTPTIIDPDTGNPSKIFYTRYGKTWDRNKTTGLYESAIDRGTQSYARLNLSGFPTFFN